MALTSSEKKELEIMMRKEIKDFFDSNTAKQFEEKLINKISKEIEKGELKKNVKEIVIKSFQEYFATMYQQRYFWESKFRNA